MTLLDRWIVEVTPARGSTHYINDVCYLPSCPRADQYHHEDAVGHATAKVIPLMKDRLLVVTFCVPTIAMTLMDLTCELETSFTVEVIYAKIEQYMCELSVILIQDAIRAVLYGMIGDWHHHHGGVWYDIPPMHPTLKHIDNMLSAIVWH